MNKRTYRIAQVTDIQAGDIVKISHRTVVASEILASGEVALSFDNGARGVFFGTERFGVYR